MARKASPWYREERNEWCVTIKGLHHRLGQHPEGAPRPQKSKKTGRWNAPVEIEKEFRRLMDLPAPKAEEPPPPGEDDVVSVLDDFITWCKENREALTAKRYEEFCQEFVRADVGGVKAGTLPVSRLTSKH